MQEIRPKAQFSRPVYSSPQRVAQQQVEEEAGVYVGQRVQHAKFGPGVVLNLEGGGAQARVQVNFEQAGSKWLMLSLAKLNPL